MVDKLIIRVYSVGVGDCIHVRIPHGRTDGDDFHLLIDCGTRGKAALLKAAVDHLKANLPEVAGKRRLDMMLISHEHEDHIKGVDPKWLADVAIENLWMSAAMNRAHPQAKFKHSFHDEVAAAMRGIAARGLALSPDLQDMVSRYSIANEGAIEALTKDLPASNKIEPLYVHAGLPANELRPTTLAGATFKVLGPQENIDYYYLGLDAAKKVERLSLTGAAATDEGSQNAHRTSHVPPNISRRDFERLKARMMSNLFAFAEEEGEIVNNTSVMLLIEWQGRRLLFVGDAEWNSRFVPGRKNFAWNVAWEKHKQELKEPIDFLKVGHHGSTNSTPWNDREDGEDSEPAQILDAILPLPEKGKKPKAQAVVSTDRTKYDSIPKAPLLVELGRRVSNTRRYGNVLDPDMIAGLPLYETHEKIWLDKSQPWRTDLETAMTGQLFVEVAIKPIESA
jgi:beta-lactamase superfamily II metal-dependent hydrolase